MRTRLLLALLGLSLPVALAQPLTQLPNANFSRWTEAEPTGWQTNNVYDDQGQLQQALVIPVGSTGAKLVAKRVTYRTEEPAIAAWYGGQLSSTLIPYLPAQDKPVVLIVRYQFRPDSEDVLRADVRLDSRDYLPGGNKPDPACTCRFNGQNGPVTLSPGETAATFRATFASSDSPGQVPRRCAMYVWKIRFWLENKRNHLHETTQAIIEQVTITQ